MNPILRAALALAASSALAAPAVAAVGTPVGAGLVPGIAPTNPNYSTIVAQAYTASGLGAVPSTISAASASNPITPVAGRGGLHWLISGTGVATCAMEQQVGGAWYPITINGSPFGVISYNVSGATNGSFTSGSLSVTLVQP